MLTLQNQPSKTTQWNKIAVERLYISQIVHSTYKDKYGAYLFVHWTFNFSSRLA